MCKIRETFLQLTHNTSKTYRKQFTVWFVLHFGRISHFTSFAILHSFVLSSRALQFPKQYFFSRMFSISFIVFLLSVLISVVSLRSFLQKKFCFISKFMSFDATENRTNKRKKNMIKCHQLQRNDTNKRIFSSL